MNNVATDSESRKNRRAALGLILVSIISISIFALWWVNAHDPNSAPPYKPSERIIYMWGLHIGMADKDVLFEKGDPDAKLVAADKPNELWAFNRGKTTYSVQFQLGKIVSLFSENLDPIMNPYRDASETDVTLSAELRGTFHGILGIRFGDVPSTVTAYLGDPEFIAELDQGARRRYDYVETLNVAFVFERGRVISMSVGGY